MSILAGMVAKTETPWWDDPPVMAYSVLMTLDHACRNAGVRPVGALTCQIVPSWDGTDEALRWEFTPEGGQPPSTPSASPPVPSPGTTSAAPHPRQAP